jgi:hypothetical protein
MAFNRIERSPSFGEQLGKNLGSGIGQGFGNQLARGIEKYTERQENLSRSKALSQGLGGQSAQDDGTSQGSQATYIPPEKMGQAVQSIVEGSKGMYSPEQAMQLNQNRNQSVLQNESIQEKAGNRAKEKLTEVLQDATPGEQEMLAKEAERLSQSGLSYADQGKALSKFANKYANQIETIDQSVPSKKFWSKMFQRGRLQGSLTDKDVEDTAKNLVKPLLDLGQTERARLSLAKRGFYAEDVEKAVDQMAGDTIATVNRLPKSKARGSSYSGKGDYLEGEGLKKFEQNLKEVLTQDPTANLILLREAYANKGVPWNAFQRAINNLSLSGEFNFADNPKQASNMRYLSEPPYKHLHETWFGAYKDKKGK